MEANYNADMYITPSDFDEVENKLEEVTNRVQDIIYFEETSGLRNIVVGDDLSGKTLYLSFPRNLYESIINPEFNFILESDNDYKIRYRLNYDNGFHNIGIIHNSISNVIYGKLDSEENVYINIVRFKLPNDFGIITNIDTTHDIYQYIKIYEDETIIPNYIKKDWSQNEIPFMQDVDRIEQGIKNLGDYCTKPLGWVTPRVWLETNTIDDRSDYNVGSKGFSYQDINRWITDLNLIDNVDMERGTFWNTNKTEYIWNEEDD